jgi:16S rRNA (cytidine1402-2'-O)-methyltransferase
MSTALYIVATPIGNLADISERAIQVLKSVNLIAAEDTRHSRYLLDHLGISTPTLSLHNFNEQQRSAQLLAQLQQGESIALISDAGTPLISDPGYHLVQAARLQGVKVIPIPGACAAITALCAAGLPTDRFSFEGFLPVKKTTRLQALQQVQIETRTLIFYEAPHRIIDLLEDMLTVFGSDREVVVARELTKLFETIKAGNLVELLDWIKADHNQQKGEFVVLVRGVTAAPKPESEKEILNILNVLLDELPVSQAASLAAKITGEKKNKVYELALELKKS